MSKYTATIGIEVHVELKTSSKVFFLLRMIIIVKQILIFVK